MSLFIPVTTRPTKLNAISSHGDGDGDGDEDVDGDGDGW